MIGEHKNYFLSFLLFLLFFRCLNAGAKHETWQFKNITPDMGLSHGEIYSIFQDHYGFMWFGTTDGLNKYDGISFTVYKHNDKDTNSLSSSFVSCIYEDKLNNLWIGTSNGICQYNRDRDNFENIYFPDNYNSQFNKPTRVFFEDCYNNFWVGTLYGVYLLDRRNRKFSSFFDNVFGKNILIQCSDIVQDNNKNLWFSFYNENFGGIVKYNPLSREIIKYDNTSPVLTLKENTIKHLLLDYNGNIWIGYNSKGIDVYNEKTKTLVNYHKGQFNNSVNSNSVYSMAKGNNGTILIGIDGGGLDVFDPLTNTFYHNVQTEAQNSILSNNVPCIFKGKDGTIWLSCWNAGISVYNNLLNRFAIYKNEKQNSTSLAGTSVTCFSQDSYGNIWVSTDGGGINLFNVTQKNFTRNLNIANNPWSLTNNKVLALESDNKGGLWAGMWQGGLNFFKVVDNKLVLKKKFNLVDESDPNSNSIFNIYRDKNNNIWVGNFHTGLYLYNEAKSKFDKIILQDKNGNIFRGDNFNDILNDDDGHLWIATQDEGILKYDFQTGITLTYNTHQKSNFTLQSNFVNVVFKDSKNRIWTGLNDAGLGLYDAQKDKFISYSVADGLPDNTVVGILEDDHGNLWISHHNGISKVMIRDSSGKISLYFRNFKVQDGLQGKIFNRWAFFKSNTGEMYFGGLNGFNVFHPDSIKENPNVPNVYLTDFFLFNKHVTIGAKDSPLKKHISQLDELVLNYNQNNFTINFIALNYIFSENNQYAYIMEGIDKDWNYIGTKKEATFTGVEPGRYIFRVKASNNDLKWNNSCISLKIIILPPWWRTWWLRWFLRLLVAVLIIFLIFKLIKRIEHRANQTILNQRNQLKTLIDNIPDYIFIKDRKLRYLVLNKSAVRFLGAKSESELINKNEFDLYQTEIAEAIIKQESEIIDSGIPLLNKESKMLMNGKEVVISATKSPIINTKNEKIGIICILRDITLQKNAEKEIVRQSEELRLTNEKLIEHQETIEEQAKELRIYSENLKGINELLIMKQQQLKETNEELSLLNATKDRFFSIIAHDLRNPFNVVTGFSEILLKNFNKMPYEKILKYLDMIYTSSVSGNNLLENLLQWSRSQTGRISFEPIKLNLLSVAEETIKLLEGEAERKNIVLKQLIDTNIVVSADENMLKTIFRNLISNAIKFTHSNGIITLKSHIYNGEVMINISDTGIGISEETVANLFKVETIISTKGTSKEKGTGLGLIICKDFIERHNGKIIVKSKVGVGSEFSFTLPLE